MKKLQNCRIDPQRFFYFSKAAHPPMDATSPPHGPFNVYDDSGMRRCPVDPIGCLLYYREMRKHQAAEETITDDQLNQAVKGVRQQYGDVFGQKALVKATGDFLTSLFFFAREQSDGQNGPTGVNLGNLGTITVHANGDEKYDGPLKGFQP